MIDSKRTDVILDGVRIKMTRRWSDLLGEGEPERNLMCAIIWQAAKDLKHHDEEIRLDALEYITGPNYAHDCDLLFGRYLPLEELI